MNSSRRKVKPAEPAYTLYRIKGGDMLSSICATYGLKQSKVLELNPGLEPNKLFVGKQIKLPGTIDLKDADKKSLEKKAVAPAKKATKAASGKVASYKGATKEYVVASGDSLGKIAYSNGITIKCLKEMNGLKKNTIRIGQKLKIPAEKPVAEVKAAPVPVKAKPAPAKAETAPVAKPQPAPSAPAAEEKQAEAPAAAEAPAVTAPAEETKPAEPAAPVATEPVAEEPAAASEASSLTHTVKDGEDTVSIAIMYGVSPSVVMDLNDLKNTDSLKVGQVLKLPANAKAQ